eukprot:5159797-Amphidinium_carterae.1
MSEQVDADGDADTVTFRVGAEHFKVCRNKRQGHPNLNGIEGNSPQKQKYSSTHMIKNCSKSQEK